MTYGNINITGEIEENGVLNVPVSDLDGLSVQLSINEEGDLPSHRCANCGEETDQDDIVMFGVESCDGSGNMADCPTHIVDGDGDCESCDGSGELEIHDWEPIPLNWCNSASIHARPDRDEIQVTISVGDPRGAFVLAVESREDGLYLSVPHAGMGMSHMPLTERSAGWYKIGN